VAYELRLSENGRVTEFRKIWTDLTFRHKLGFWQNFDMTSPETLYTKNAVNEHRFLMVTHMAYFNTRFGRYDFFKLGYGAELFWTAWTLERIPSFSGPKQVNLGEVWLQILQLTGPPFWHILIHMILSTIAMVTAIQKQHSCGVSRFPEIASSMVGNPEMVSQLGEDYDF
jgi:hypothetical protein